MIPKEEQVITPEPTFFRQFSVTRRAMVEALKESKHTQILVLGGGLEAALLARFLALNRYRCLLLCPTDFGEFEGHSLPGLSAGHLFGESYFPKTQRQLFLSHSAPHLLFPIRAESVTPTWRSLLATFLCALLSNHDPKAHFAKLKSEKASYFLTTSEVHFSLPRLIAESVFSARQEGALTLNHIRIVRTESPKGQHNLYRWEGLDAEESGSIEASLLIDLRRGPSVVAIKNYCGGKDRYLIEGFGGAPEQDLSTKDQLLRCSGNCRAGAFTISKNHLCHLAGWGESIEKARAAIRTIYHGEAQSIKTFKNILLPWEYLDWSLNQVLASCRDVVATFEDPLTISLSRPLPGSQSYPGIELFSDLPSATAEEGALKWAKELLGTRLHYLTAEAKIRPQILEELDGVLLRGILETAIFHEQAVTVDDIIERRLDIPPTSPKNAAIRKLLEKALPYLSAMGFRA